MVISCCVLITYIGPIVGLSGFSQGAITKRVFRVESTQHTNYQYINPMRLIESTLRVRGQESRDPREPNHPRCAITISEFELEPESKI